MTSHVMIVLISLFPAYKITKLLAFCIDALPKKIPPDKLQFEVLPKHWLFLVGEKVAPMSNTEKAEQMAGNPIVNGVSSS